MNGIFLSLSFLISVQALAQSSAPRPFLTPLLALQKGPAKFECREPGDLNGLGGQRARFTLSQAQADGAFTVTDAQIGNADQDGLVSNWQTPRVDFKAAQGQIYAANRPQFERIHFSASYKGPAREGELPVGRIVSFTLNQDASTKLVFARYKDIAILKRAEAGCGSTAHGCSDTSKTIFDNVYLCDFIP